ncbi:MAG: hypothetical protein ACI3YK_06980 [Eubacteriales bacterium]
MDYKQSKNFFSKTYLRNLMILAVCGAALILLMAVVWWFLWEYIPDLVSEILMVVGAAMIIASITMRPKEKYLMEQIEEQIPTFRQDTADKLKLPSDFDDESLTLWGFCEGNTQKVTKTGKILTDRIQISVLYLKKNDLYIRTERLCLTADERSVMDYSLPLAETRLTVSEDETSLICQSGEETVVLSIREKDYNLEQYLELVAHKQR